MLCFSLISINQQLTMPRRPRIVLPGVPLHLIQRGNNRQACFFEEGDYRFYLEWLITYAKDAGCAVHAYMPTCLCADDQSRPSVAYAHNRQWRG